MLVWMRGRRSRYSNWTLGDEAVYTDPLHEFLFNSGSANLEGSDWLELHMFSISYQESISGLHLVSAARDELSSSSILVASCLYLLPKQREVKVAPIDQRKTDIYLLPE